MELRMKSQRAKTHNAKESSSPKLGVCSISIEFYT